MQNVFKPEQIMTTPMPITQAERDMLDFEHWRLAQLALAVKKANQRILEKRDSLQKHQEVS